MTRIYEVRIERVITYATQCATLLVLAPCAAEAEGIAVSKVSEGEVVFDDIEVQEDTLSCIPEELTPEELTPEELTPEELTPEELTPEGRIATLMRVIRDIQANTVDSRLLDDDIIGVIQRYCKYALDLEKQARDLEKQVKAP